MKPTPLDTSRSPVFPRNAVRQLAVNLALLLAALAGTLAAVEGVLCWSNLDQPDPALYPGDRIAAEGIQADSAIGWKMPSDTFLRAIAPTEYDVTYRSDSLGFRRGETVGRAAAGHRLLFLGDSFTFGVGVDYGQTFPGQIEHDLPDTRSYNLAMTGFGLDQMWRTLHRYGRGLAPSVIVVSFIDDDLHRSLTAYRRRETRGRGGTVWWRKPTYRLAGDSLVPESEADRPSALASLVERHSRLWELWRRGLWRLGLQYGAGPYWRLNNAIFRAIRDESRAAGAHLLVVRIPAKGQRRPAPAIGPAMAREGIGYLDLTTVLPSQVQDCYFRQDPHLNARGHAWVAREIERVLVARGWEPPAGPRLEQARPN